MLGFESSPVVSVIERVPRKSEFLVRFSDGSELRVLKEHLGRFHLEEGACVDQALIEEMGFVYACGKARQVALRLLKVRPRTEKELMRRFRAKGIPGDVSDKLIADLKAEGLVDDSVFARLWAEEKVSRGRHGKKLIRHELKAKGIDPEIVEHALETTYSDAKEMKLARRLALDRLAKTAGLSGPAAKRRVFGHLLRRGFPSHVASEAVASLGTPNTGEDQV